MTVAPNITLRLPAAIEIGAGAAGRLQNWAADFNRILLLTTPHTKAYVERLGLRGDVAIYDDILGEPDIRCYESALAAARTAQPDLVIGLGGGSVLDVAKLVAALWDGDQRLADVAGPNRVAGRRSALVQIATTAGTGSEAGIRALITDNVSGTKIAVESPYLLADLAILDPELSFTVPPAVTAATGIDALAHCVEAFTSRKAHPVIDGFARMGIGLVGQYLARAVRDGTDTEAREGMMLASFYGGICLGPVNTAAGHALAYPLGTLLHLPHGLANAIIFPHVVAFNQPVIPGKTKEIATALGFGDAVTADQMLRAGYDFCLNLGIEMRLSAHGADESMIKDYAENACAIRRLMDNNPREMSQSEAEAIYRAALS